MTQKKLLLLAFTIITSSLASAQSVFPYIARDTLITDGAGGFPADSLDPADYFGFFSANIGDLDGDGIADLATSAYRDDDGGTDRGAVYILFLNSNGSVKSSQKISDTQGGFTGALDNGDYFGASLAGLGDLDGDGINDLAVGATYDDDGASSNSGAVWILFLDSDGTVKSHQKISNSDGGLTTTLGGSDFFGSSLANVGDFDGDGVTDLAVGAIYDDDGANNAGAVYILTLDSDGTVDSEAKISSTSGNFTETLDISDAFGSSVTSIGDIDNNGVTDIAVGAYLDDDEDTNAGAVYTLLLNADGSVKSSEKLSATLDGKSKVMLKNWYFGFSVANAGDVDGDGIYDIIAGAHGAANGSVGRFYIITLNNDGSVKSYMTYGKGYGWNISGATSTGYLARSVTWLGDLNNDGASDYAIGSNTGTNEGAVTIVFGDGSNSTIPGAGVVLDFTKLTTDLGGYGSNQLGSSDYFGSAAAAEDLDGDGIEDLIVGISKDDDGGTDRGAVEILLMNSNSTVKSRTKISNNTTNFSTYLGNSDLFGCSVTSIGDLNGDGNIDLAVGAYSDDDGGTGRGAVYIMFLDSAFAVDSVQKISSINGGLTGPLNDNDRFGISVANVGDIDGDGVVDIAVGASLDDDGGSGRGAVYILFLNTDGTVSSEQKISKTIGGLSYSLSAGDGFGSSICNLGDIDGDGNTDIAVGLPHYASEEGKIIVLLLDDDGTVISESVIGDSELSDALASFDLFGASLTVVDDLDGNGTVNIAVGAERNKVGDFSNGAVYMLNISDTGTVVDFQRIGAIDGNLKSNIQAFDYFGSSVAFLGDLDGNGQVELAVGAERDDDAASDGGAIHVLSLSTPAILLDTSVYAELSKTLSGGHYTAQQGQLYFRYDEEYFDSDSALVYNVYDWNNDVVLSQADQAVDVLFGDNRCFLDMSCNGTTLDQGYFILEVINEKKEKWYLRFHNNVICSGTGLME